MNKRELQGILKRPIAFFRIFAQVGGSAQAGLFLSQAHYWSDKTIDPDGWFYKTQAEWEQETALTRREQETARRDLKERGLIEEKKKGMPAQLFYRVNYDALCAAVDAWLSRLDAPALADEAADMDGGNRQTRMAESARHESTKAPGMDGGNPPALSTENTAESTQIPERSKLNEKTNGNGEDPKRKAALIAFAKLDPGDQKFISEQSKLQRRPVEAIMWELRDAECVAALRASAGK